MHALLRSVAVAITALLLGFSGVAAAQSASLEIDIPPQALGPALLQLAEKYQLQILFSPEAVKGVNTSRAKGRYTVSEAVAKLIEGTPLTYSFNGKDTVVVRPAAAAGAAQTLPRWRPASRRAPVRGTGRWWK